MSKFTPKPIKFLLTVRGKVLLSLAFLAIYAASLFFYSLVQKEVLLEKINEIDNLQEAETVLLAADLAVFDAITQLLIMVDPTTREEVIQEI